MMLEQLDENDCFAKIKAREMPGMDGHLLLFDRSVTFERMGLKPFRDEVDGLGPASMAVVRVPQGGEFLLSLFDHLQDQSPESPLHGYSGIDVQCQGAPSLEMLKAFLVAAATSDSHQTSPGSPTTGLLVGIMDVCWVSPLVLPLWSGQPQLFKDDGTRI